MHLQETSLIKKYESDIGKSIEGVGGDVTYRDHWLPRLDGVISNQLVGNDVSSDIRVIDREIDKKLAQLPSTSITQEEIDAWNALIREFPDLEGRVTRLEGLPATDITSENINAWNALIDRVSDIEVKPAMDITSGEINNWNSLVIQVRDNLKPRVEDLEDLTNESCIWKQETR